MLSKRIPLSISILALVLLAACMPGTPNAAATLNPMYTAAAQTLEALITQAAVTPTATTQASFITPMVSPIGGATSTLGFPDWPVASATWVPRTATAITRCDWAYFVKDITVPDGSTIERSTSFTKTWRIKNIGTCTWTNAYTLVYSGGSQMSGPASLTLPGNVAPGQSVDISVNLIAPSSDGHYRGYWMLRNPSGVLFGIGAQANSAFWVDINVVTRKVIVFDFVVDYCGANWTSNAGTLPCPGGEGDLRGYVIKLTSPRLENGTVQTQPALLTFPQYVTDGYISGKYPAFSVQNGDHFIAYIGCEYGATSCNVTFRLDYQIGSGPIKTLATWQEKYEGLYFTVDVDLASLAGKSVQFILTVLANGSPNQDRAIWYAPRITRPYTGTATFTASPTLTQTPTSTATNTNTSTPTETSTETPTPTP